MERVIVTVKRLDEAKVRDLDVPAGLSADELANVIASALNWDKDSSGKKQAFNIQADPPGRLLKEGESLNSAGVMDGAWLTFVREGVENVKKVDTPLPITVENQEISQGPIQGWKALEGISKQEVSEDEKVKDTKDDDSQSPYIWKEVDI